MSLKNTGFNVQFFYKTEYEKYCKERRTEIAEVAASCVLKVISPTPTPPSSDFVRKYCPKAQTVFRSSIFCFHSSVFCLPVFILSSSVFCLVSSVFSFHKFKYLNIVKFLKNLNIILRMLQKRKQISF